MKSGNFTVLAMLFHFQALLNLLLILIGIIVDSLTLAAFQLDQIIL